MPNVETGEEMELRPEIVLGGRFEGSAVVAAVRVGLS